MSQQQQIITALERFGVCLSALLESVSGVQRVADDVGAEGIKRIFGELSAGIGECAERARSELREITGESEGW